jgi:hypothetical protein
LPPTQLWLQQSLAFMQLLPAVLQVLSGLQVPLSHWVLQHCWPPTVQGCPSETQAAALQVPLTQLRLQQSVAWVQLAPV